MSLIRIKEAVALDGYRLQLKLTDGTIVIRDVEPFLQGPLFELLRNDYKIFQQVQVFGGTVVWPNGADLCPDVLIWGGAPPKETPIFSAPQSFHSSTTPT